MADDKPDPVTVISLHWAADPPETALVGICRRSTAAKYAADAGPGDEVTDHGPAALLLTQLWDAEPRRSLLGAGLVRVGLVAGGKWAAWFLPSFRVEPPPGTPGSAARAN